MSRKLFSFYCKIKESVKEMWSGCLYDRIIGYGSLEVLKFSAIVLFSMNIVEFWGLLEVLKVPTFGIFDKEVIDVLILCVVVLWFLLVLGVLEVLILFVVVLSFKCFRCSWTHWSSRYLRVQTIICMRVWRFYCLCC